MQMGGFALYTVSSVYYVNEIIPVQDAVKGQSFLGAAGTIGAVAANVLGGALLDASGVPLLLTVCTIVSAVGAAIVWCAVQTKKARRLLSSTDFAGRTCYNGATAYPMRVYFPTRRGAPDPKCRLSPRISYPRGLFIWQRRTIHHRPSPDIFADPSVRKV